MEDIEITSSFNVQGALSRDGPNDGAISDSNRRKNGNFHFIMSIAKAGLIIKAFSLAIKSVFLPI